MNKLFEYEIKGIKLDINDMITIHSYYEAACTAEYIMENYKIDKTKDALELGYEVRRIMDKHGYTEAEAIEEVLEEYGGTL